MVYVACLARVLPQIEVHETQYGTIHMCKRQRSLFSCRPAQSQRSLIVTIIFWERLHHGLLLTVNNPRLGIDNEAF